MRSRKTPNKLLAGGAAVLVGLGLAAAPAISASADWLSYGYAACSSPTHPTTMSTSIGYTYHQISDGAGTPWREDAGSGASKFHSMGIANTTALGSAMEIYNYSYHTWSCAGSGYYATGW